MLTRTVPTALSDYLFRIISYVYMLTDNNFIRFEFFQSRILELVFHVNITLGQIRTRRMCQLHRRCIKPSVASQSNQTHQQDNNLVLLFHGEWEKTRRQGIENDQLYKTSLKQRTTISLSISKLFPSLACAAHSYTSEY